MVVITNRHICGICVKLKSLLKTHYKQVNGAYPLDYKIPRNVRTHTGSQSGKFCCLICNKRFRFKASLEGHIRTHPISKTCLDIKQEIKDEGSDGGYGEESEEFVDINNDFQDQLASNGTDIDSAGLPGVISIGSNEASAAEKNEGESVPENVPSFPTQSGENNSCPICQKEFRNIKAVEKHTKIVHKEVWESSQADLAQKNDENNYCSFCERVFKNKKGLRDHNRKIHDIRVRDALAQDDNLTCHLCHKEYKHKKALRDHKRVVHREHATPVKEDGAQAEVGSHACLFCDKVFSDAWIMEKHAKVLHNVKLHSFKESWPCPLCPRRYKDLKGVRDHVRVQHNRAWSSIDEETRERVKKLVVVSTGKVVTEKTQAVHKQPQKTHTCKDCSKVFKQRHLLTNHMHVHTGERRHSCEVCGARFGHRNTLMLHLRIHTGEKPYKCPHCERRFNQCTGLKRHKIVHTREYNFSCHICGKRFLRQPHLSFHLKKHADIKNHKCEQCGKAFILAYLLRKHYSVHSGERPFVCELCGAGFKWRRNLVQHNKSQHPEKYKKERLARRKIEENSSQDNVQGDSAEGKLEESPIKGNVQENSTKGKLEENSTKGTLPERSTKSIASDTKLDMINPYYIAPNPGESTISSTSSFASASGYWNPGYVVPNAQARPDEYSDQAVEGHATQSRVLNQVQFPYPTP